MRDLGKYSTKDWLRLRPLVERLKRLRYDFVQRKFLKARPAALDEFLAANGRLKGKNIVSVIGFEQPEVLEFSLKMTARHLADATVIVLDNSRRKEARTQIERVCQTYGAPYLGLPENPTRHPNRSHGMAMTWIWHNVVKPLRPGIAGFIDHDVIPVKKIELKQLLAGQPLYGVPNVSRWAWSLWAGFCFYDFEKVGSLPLNFLNDFPHGVDTGGRNWEILYQRYDHKDLKFAEWRLFDVMDESAGVPRQVEVIDGAWMHIGGTSCRNMYRKNADFYARMLQAIEAGANWDQLRSEMGGGTAIRPTPIETITKSGRQRWQKSSFRPVADNPA
jgi:hypothetical protein